MSVDLGAVKSPWYSGVGYLLTTAGVCAVYVDTYDIISIDINQPQAGEESQGNGR